MQEQFEHDFGKISEFNRHFAERREKEKQLISLFRHPVVGKQRCG